MFRFRLAAYKFCGTWQTFWELEVVIALKKSELFDAQQTFKFLLEFYTGLGDITCKTASSKNKLYNNTYLHICLHTYTVTLMFVFFQII